MEELKKLLDNVTLYINEYDKIIEMAKGNDYADRLPYQQGYQSALRSVQRTVEQRVAVLALFEDLDHED